MANAHDLLMAQRAAMMGEKPYLKRVAYLESHGNEIIDTGVYGGWDSFIEFDFKYHQTKTGNKEFGLFGNKAANNQGTTIYISSDYSRDLNCWCGTGTGFNILRTTSDSPHVCSIRFNGSSGRKCIIDDVEYNSNHHNNAKGVDKRFAVFDDNTIGKADLTYNDGLRFYYAKIIKDNDLKIDLIPVLDLSGRPAMYDEVSGQLFYNQGTGEFTWGELET